MARTEILVPIADVFVEWEAFLGLHYPALADDSDLTYVSTLSDGAVDRVEIEKLPTDVASVDSFSLRARIDSATGAGTVRPRVFDGTTILYGPTWTAPLSPTWFTWTPANAPDGGAWTREKVNALVSVGIESVSVGFGELRARKLEAWVVVQEVSAITGRPVGVIELPPAGPAVLELPPIVASTLELAKTTARLDAPAVDPVLEMAPLVAALDFVD